VSPFQLANAVRYPAAMGASGSTPGGLGGCRERVGVPGSGGDAGEGWGRRGGVVAPVAPVVAEDARAPVGGARRGSTTEPSIQRRGAPRCHASRRETAGGIGGCQERGRVPGRGGGACGATRRRGRARLRGGPPAWQATAPTIQRGEAPVAIGDHGD